MHDRNAALYLRSSKDRHDVSIDSQRRELRKLALEKGLPIVDEFRDIVESGKDEHRPGFQLLLRAIKSPGRGWSTLLLTDTARLFRGRYGAQAFKHECRKRGVKILYSKVPEVDPISQVILEAVFEAMDEVHSLMSRDKGLAGMAENVRAGFRAGGRAPRGYVLVKHPTGAFRDGAPVEKSRLDLDPACAHQLTTYLKLRAKGAARARAKSKSGINVASSSLVDLEWNALTYACHTVWNVRNEFSQNGGYSSGRKRRPRSEWMIKRDTHPAMITDAEAETLLARLENNPFRKSGRSSTAHLLTGLLKTPNGSPWYGNGGRHYRTKPAKGTKGAYVDLKRLEGAVMSQVVADLTSPEKVRAMTRRAQAEVARAEKDPAKDVRPKLAEIEKRISRTMDLAGQMENPAPAIRKVQELEAEREGIRQHVAELEKSHQQAIELAQIAQHEVRRFLVEICGDLESGDRQLAKEVLRIQLD